MCGISGYILKNRVEDASGWKGALMRAIRMRGPDDEGACSVDRVSREMWIYATERSMPVVQKSAHFLSGSRHRHDAAFFHSRYAIIDISAGGHQPFVSQDGEVVVVFNGEIYNYLELKEELQALGVSFWTSSDTEVLVEGYRYWKDALWPKLNGFWAVALYDKRDNRIVFSRDRLGVAPLYYRETEEGLFFSSVIAPLVDLAPRAEVDKNAVSGFIDTGYKDVDDTTMYEGVFSFPAGSFAVIEASGVMWRKEGLRRFWDLPKTPWKEKDISFKEAVSQVHDTFMNAVQVRLRADVNVAFELSGGMDSSSIVAAAAQMSSAKITAFTLKVKGRDESFFARSVARRYGVDLRVMSGLEASLPEECESFSRIMEEPYDTPANFTHHLMLNKIKAEGFQVLLTGAGGDETFAGYEASFWPAILKEARACGGDFKKRAEHYEYIRRWATWQESRRTLENGFRKILRYSRKLSVPERPEGCSAAHQYYAGYGKKTFFEQRLFHVKTALLPYYLRSTDHYTMHIPLEHRFPMLDYRLVELGVKMPVSYLFRDGWTKYVLRRAMAPYLPHDVVWRRKKYGFPFDFKRYFHGKEDVWGPYMKGLSSCGVEADKYGTYVLLAKTNPVLLWRLISAGVWTSGIDKELL